MKTHSSMSGMWRDILFLSVPLTSIQMDFEQGGYLAVSRLLDLVYGRCRSDSVFGYPVLKVVHRMSTRITPTPATAFANRVVDFLRDNVDRGLTIDSLAKYFGYSRRQTEKLFRAGSGKTILSAIHDAIYDRACLLVKDPKVSIGFVADAVGVSRGERVDGRTPADRFGMELPGA